MSEELVPIIRTATPAELKSAIGNSLADVWQVLVGDRISAYRLRNAAAINRKLRTRFAQDEHSIDWDRVPERFAVSWFEHATNEDEPTIQDLFATLLARAAEGSEDALARRNIELVARLSSSDAMLLEAIYEAYHHKYDVDADGIIWLDEWAEFQNQTKRLDPPIDPISYENLENIGVIAIDRISSLDETKLERWVKGQTGMDDGGRFFVTYPVNDAVNASDEVNLTLTGRSLLRALF